MKQKSHASSPPDVRDARIIKTDSALRQALLSLLERKPIEQILIRDIAAEAGVHYTTFFRHHPSKEALLDHVATDQIARLVELSVPVQDAVNTHAAFVALCNYVNDHRALWTALLLGGAAGTMRAELMRVSGNIARHRIRQTEWIPVELSVTCSVTVIVETLSWWLKQPTDEVPVDEVAKILTFITKPTSVSVPRPQ
ncbi:MAG TPA: TetR/AcrR family transcriptional regulator [Sphingobium sp.]|uniref:TetR/AcrR family transcriptional regulator n=1 Tax=Sphingobium sp. TaxID=1912891 RepID=UPI002ED5E631